MTPAGGKASILNELPHNVDHLPSSRAHLFDGVTPSKDTAAFQLCDITDPMLKRMIESQDALREECNVRLSQVISVSTRLTKRSSGT
jgi:hypothetical protein